MNDMEGGVDDVEERRVGRERVGGRRWSSRESKSPASGVEKWLVV